MAAAMMMRTITLFDDRRLGGSTLALKVVVGAANYGQNYYNYCHQEYVGTADAPDSMSVCVKAFAVFVTLQNVSVHNIIQPVQPLV